jgi:protein-tyrosine-phosphatase
MRYVLARRPRMAMSTDSKPLNVLFLCTHNSARSILAEALLNALGNGRFRAYSAGSSPREHQRPHPMGLQVLQAAGIPIEGLHSKSWDVFASRDAPVMDLIITVCGNAVHRAVKIRFQKHVRRALTENKDWALCASIRTHGAEAFAVLLVDVVRGRKPAHAIERKIINGNMPELNTH